MDINAFIVQNTGTQSTAVHTSVAHLTNLLINLGIQGLCLLPGNTRVKFVALCHVMRQHANTGQLRWSSILLQE